jgi:hypothetical protein
MSNEQQPPQNPVRQDSPPEVIQVEPKIIEVEKPSPFTIATEGFDPTTIWKDANKE